MSVVGIVCEYNPFHKGHLLHIQNTLQAFGNDSTVVCVMSGDYVQRGEPALYSKFARAEAACLCGADLVIELPLPWCLASAEGFARGSVGLLCALGAEYLSFGSEAGNTESLEQIAEALLDSLLTERTKELMAREASLSFARARQIALEEKLGAAASIIEAPNNILAVEYIKAIHQHKLQIRPFTIQRIGSAHDSEGGEEVKSASELRKLIRRGENVEGYIPPEALGVFRREHEHGRVLDADRFEAALMSRLRLLDRDRFNLLPDAGDGLGNKLWKAAAQEACYDDVLEAAKSKRYAMSRMRRMCMCAALGVTAQMSEGIPAYARVLAANDKGFSVLKDCAKRDSIKILAKPAAAKDLSANDRMIFALGAAAHDLYTLSYWAQCERKGGDDWRSSPFIVKND